MGYIIVNEISASGWFEKSDLELVERNLVEFEDEDKVRLLED